MTAGYESVQRLIHEHLLPALERFTVLVSRLRGVSRFQVSNATLGLSTQDLNNVLDTVGCLQLLAHHLLITTNAELHQFHAFSSWLHYEIDAQSSDTNISDGPEKDPNIDHMRTLEYIQGAMTHSRLKSFLRPKAEDNLSTQWDLNAEGRSLFDLYKREINQKSRKDPSKQLPGLDALLGHLDSLCSIVFNQIGETQRRNVRFAPPISLGSGVTNRRDLRMIIEEPEKIEEVCLYVAIGSRLGEQVVQIYRIAFRNEHGMSTTKGIKCASIRTDGWIVNDIKFIDDEDIILAMSNNCKHPIIELRESYETATDKSQRHPACSDSTIGRSTVSIKVYDMKTKAKLRML